MMELPPENRRFPRCSRWYFYSSVKPEACTAHPESAMQIKLLPVLSARLAPPRHIPSCLELLRYVRLAAGQPSGYHLVSTTILELYRVTLADIHLVTETAGSSPVPDSVEH